MYIYIYTYICIYIYVYRVGQCAPLISSPMITRGGGSGVGLQIISTSIATPTTPPRTGLCLQGYLAHQDTPSPQDPTVALCLGPYGGPRGWGGFS